LGGKSRERGGREAATVKKKGWGEIGCGGGLGQTG